LAEKTDLMGLEESSKKGIFQIPIKMKEKTTNVFSIGERAQILSPQDAGILLPLAFEGQVSF
jgi:hypothetical protein